MAVLRLVFASLLVSSLVACAPELGECDESALDLYAVDSEGRVQYAGQALLHRSCAAGVCHSSSAKGGDRQGAPRGLDFDLPVGNVDEYGNPDPDFVKRIGRSRARIRDHASHILKWVEIGAMPPSGSDVGDAHLPGYQFVTYDLGRCGFEGSVPSIRTRDGREVLRNWLACGAPVIEANDPMLARFDEGHVGKISPICVDDSIGTEITFDKVFEDVLRPYCAGSCHVPGGTNEKLVFSDVDAAYRSLMDETPDTSDCSESIAARFVDVDDPDRSYLLHKMSDAEIPRAERPICGDPMPDGEPPLVLGAAKVRAWIEQGALR